MHNNKSIRPAKRIIPVLIIFAATFLIAGIASAAATASPGNPVLSHDNWDHDGDYTVTMNMWWGNNGDTVRLYENGALSGEETFSDKSPDAQSYSWKYSGKSGGDYEYYAVLSNEFGETQSGAVTVTVSDSASKSSGVPGSPVLSHDNWDHDGDYIITMNMWWGNNGDTVRLYENGVFSGEGTLSDKSPDAQSYSWKYSGKSGGDYEYYAVLSNDFGDTRSGAVTVTVSDSASKASGVPGNPVLSHDNWDQNGDYTITMNMWWGNNGDTVRLYENGVLSCEGTLSDKSPDAQSYSWKYSGKSGGDYVYYAVLSNSLGSTTGGPVTVTVDGAPTATPSPTVTATPAPTAVPTESLTVSPTPVPTATPSPTVTATPAPTAVPTESPTVSPTSVPTETPSPTMTATPVPTAAPTESPTPAPTPVPVENSSELTKRIVMYFAEWGIYSDHLNYYPADVPWNKITHINYAFGIIKDGKLAIYDDWAATGHTFGTETWDSDYKGVLGQFKKLKEQYPDVKQMISVGGWTRSDQFHFVAATEESRARFAASVVDYIRLYGFDGVDIDWEYPTVYRPASGQYDQGCPYADETETETFTLLLRDLRSALDTAGEEDGKYYELSAAVGAGKAVIDKTELDKYPQYLDFINLMTYDMHGQWDLVTGHLSPLYTNPDAPYDDVMMQYGSTDAVVKIFKDAGVPSDKLVVGIPYYTRGWKEVQNNGPVSGLPGLFASANGAPSDIGIEPGMLLWRSVEDYENDPSYVKYRDVVSGNIPYLYSEAKGIMLTYEDEISVQEKADYIISHNLGGAIVWEASGEEPGYTPLTDILYNTFSG